LRARFEMVGQKLRRLEHEGESAHTVTLTKTLTGGLTVTEWEPK